MGEKSVYIVYCKNCGEYLGDRIDGTLYKFGKPVVKEHVCLLRVDKNKLDYSIEANPSINSG